MRSLSDEEIKLLLDESFKKISKGTELDTKKLNDMNNTLNWILTLTTFFFVIYNQLKIELFHTNLIPFALSFKIMFVASIGNLILHKYLLIQYEDFKGVYIRTLNSQYIDFLVNIEKIRPYVEKIVPFQTPRFMNKFRDGKLAYHNERDETIAFLKKTDDKINYRGGFIKITYFIGMALFVLEFLFISLCIFQ